MEGKEGGAEDIRSIGKRWERRGGDGGGEIGVEQRNMQGLKKTGEYEKNGKDE